MRCGAVRCGAVRCGAVRCGAVRCGAVRAGLRSTICQNMRGGAGCGPGYIKICGAGWDGPNDIVAGAGAGSAFSARAVSLKMCTLSVPISWLIT